MHRTYPEPDAPVTPIKVGDLRRAAIRWSTEANIKASKKRKALRKIAKQSRRSNRSK